MSGGGGGAGMERGLPAAATAGMEGGVSPVNGGRTRRCSFTEYI